MHVEWHSNSDCGLRGQPDQTLLPSQNSLPLLPARHSAPVALASLLSLELVPVFLLVCICHFSLSGMFFPLSWMTNAPHCGLSSNISQASLKDPLPPHFLHSQHSPPPELSLDSLLSSRLRRSSHILLTHTCSSCLGSLRLETALLPLSPYTSHQLLQ